MIRHHRQDLGCIGFVYLLRQGLFPYGSLLIQQEPCQFLWSANIQMIRKRITEFSCVAEHLRHIVQLFASLEDIFPVYDHSVHSAYRLQPGTSGKCLLPDFLQ